MSDGQTRRDFLKITAGSVAAAAASDVISGQLSEAVAQQSPRGAIRVFVTNRTQKYATATPLQWEAATGASTADTIVIDPSKQFQSILGFGAAFTDAACYTFNRLSPPDREELFHQLFHPSQMGLSVGRTCIGSSDYSTEVFSYDEGEPDPQLTRFSIEHDRAYVLPILRLARQANPDLFLLSSPWSPPGWMKSSKTMLGGAIWRHYFQNYAEYFAKFLKAYAAEGVTVNAVTSQNEVDTDQDGKMPAAMLPQEYEMDFIRDHLGPTLQREGSQTKIWLLDHNYSLWGRTVCMLDDAKVKNYANAIAWHGYVGTVDSVSRVHEYHPDTEMFWTEGGPDYTAPDYQTDWSKWATTFTGILRNWCRCIIGWNLALDEHGKPNIGPFSCGGVVTINSKTKEITRSGQYYAFAHFSKSLTRGAVRIDSRSKSSVAHVAAKNPDGSYAMLLTNSGGPSNATLQMGDAQVAVPLTADSITTLSWNP